MKTLLLSLVILVIIVIAVIVYIYTKLPEFKPDVTIIELNSKKTGERIYIKQKKWGITGDHHIVVISTSPKKDFQPDSTREYVYEGLSPIFYHFANDSLELFVNNLANVPSQMRSKIKINQIVLSNSEMMSLMEDYKRKGLILIK